jgi:hypothetical protein
MKKETETVEVIYNNERHFLSPREAKIAISHMGAVEVVKFPKPVGLKNIPPPILKDRVEPIPVKLKTTLIEENNVPLVIKKTRKTRKK